MMKNPFVQKGAIRDMRYFYGRKRELRKVFDHLRAEQPQCCALVGDGKTGKSSFLHYISNPAVRKAEGLYSEKHILVYFAFQHNLEINRSDFWRRLLKDISGQIDDSLLSRDIAKVCDLEDFSKTTIEEIMRTLQLEEFKLYLLLDEFECIEKIPDLFNPDFLSQLRHLTNNYDIVCVVATEVELQDLIPETFGSPFPNAFVPIRLGLLSEDEARELIEQAKNPVEPSLLDDKPYIVRMAGRHPFLTQVVCYHLFDLKVEKGTITQYDYENVTEESLTDADPYFKGDMWPSFTKTERQLLTSIAWGQEVDSRIYRVELRQLERHKQYIRQQDGQWVIFCDLLRRFIRDQSHEPVCQPGPTPTLPNKRKSMLEYDDFEILIEQARPGEGYPIRASHLQIRDASGASSIDLEAIQADLKSILHRDIDMPFLREFGKKLLEALIVDGVRRRFDFAYGQITEGKRGLRIRLRIDPPELACLPWEFLYEKEQNRWLATSSSIALSRYVDAQPARYLSVQLPLNILLVQSNPTNLSEYGLPELKDSLKDERNNMWGALESLIDRGLVTFEILVDATTQAIREKLRPGGKEYHILHFSGYGYFADEEEELAFPVRLEKQRGYLLMQKSDKTCRLVNEDIMVDLLKDSGVRLVILNACRTAASSPTQRFVSLATSLVRSGPSAMVAMQYSLPDEVAQHFTHEFYTSLVSGLPVDVCVADARKAIATDFDRENRDWASPVLYMRSPDGVIFDIKSVDVPKAKITNSPVETERHHEEVDHVATNASMMNFDGIRKKQLMKNINRQYKLLHEYEKKRDLSDRPKEIELFNDEIIKITQSLHDYIIEFKQVCKKEGIATPQEVVSIWDELERRLQKITNGQREIMGAVSQARDAILELTIDVHKDTMRVFLSALDEQETHIVQSIVENIDRKQLTEAEMTEILKTIQQGYKELQENALPISTDDIAIQETQNLPEVWNSPDISTGGKLKLSIPIIPTILTYEAELSVNVKESLKKFWKR